jgi:high frequency lysogenization protein
MLKLLSGKTDKKDIELTRYVAGVLALAKRLLQKPAALNELKQTIDQVERRLEHFGINDDSVIANFADAYSKAISPLGQKIQVLGNPDVLRQPNVQNKIRALLLAGVRAAVLWRQMGGKRRQFIFSRKNILQDAILFHKELTSN